MAVLILSSSPRLFGSIAYESTGSGKVIGATRTAVFLSARTSLVCVSFSLATAPRSPALSSGTCVCVLPWSASRWPRRSGASRVALLTVVSDFTRARDDAQHRDATGERIGDRLPDERRVRRRVGRLRRRLGAVLADRAELALGGRRRVAHDRIEQRLHAGGMERRGAQQRVELAGHRRRSQAADQLLLGERALGEERLHQLLVGLGDHLDQLLARMLGGVDQRRRNVRFRHLAVGAEGLRLHLHQIDDADEGLLLAERELHGDDLAGAVAAQRFEGAVEARALAIQPVEDDDAGESQSGRFTPQLFRLHLDAGDGVDDDHGGFDDAQRRAGVAEEVGEAWCVDEVDLGFLPFGVGETGGERVLAGNLFVVEVGDGGAVVHPADAIDGAGGEEQGRHQLGLAASAVSDDSHVAEAGRVVDLHRGIPPAPRVFPRGGVSRPGGRPMGSASEPARERAEDGS